MTRYISLLPMVCLAACAGGGSDGNRIADLFMAADVNGDGVISRAEAPSRIDFDAADTNLDGVLTQAEVESYTQGLRG